METITVRTARPYQVYIGKEMMPFAAKQAREFTDGSRALILTDDQVGPIYAEKLQTCLAENGFEVFLYEIPHGEKSKNAKTLLEILGYLAEHQFGRRDFLLALGGGVVGDLGGLTASLYMRGIPYCQLPTSLLAMVDSSVGGKTAVDLPQGKNLMGTFCQPRAVFCDVSALQTLPEAEMKNGWAEIIKTSVIGDKTLLETKEFTELVARCVDIKRRVVEADEFDTGVRSLLNFGHTIGHAVEKLSDFTVPHGSAVAIGMAVMTRGCARMGLCVPNDAEKLEETIRSYGLPVSTEYDADSLYHAALSDKKKQNDSILLVLMRRRGVCELKTVSTGALHEIIRQGLSV